MRKQHGIFGRLADGSEFCIAFFYNASCASDIKELAKAGVSRVTGCSLLFEGRTGASDMSTAHCAPCDNFERERGRKIALARAINGSRLNKQNRTRVWNAYRARGQNSTAE